MHNTEIKEQAKKLYNLHKNIAGFYSEFAKSIGLTLSAVDVLNTIHKEENCTQKLIVQKTYLPKQTVNTIIKSFYEQGIISEPTESDTDKRNKVISFTQDGQKYADEIINKIKTAEYNALKTLGNEKTQTLLNIMEEFKNNLKLM